VSHEVVRTTGGALAIRSIDDGEVMHPGVGPLEEAEVLYVRQSRLEERLRGIGFGNGNGNDRGREAGTVVVFDVGLGAGSNALAARAVAERVGARLELVSFERDLGALALALTHGAAFGLDGESAVAARALMATGRHESAHTIWRLERGDLREALGRQTVMADVIFWDPFSPKVNPELWTAAAFALARSRAGARATLFTYSASTAVRVAMLLGGWAVGTGDAIGGKQQTTAAAVEPGDLVRPLPASWLKRLAHPDAPLPSDAPPDTIARVGAAAQFRPGS
jgi:queuine tRNA-ribosyltransferase